MMKVGWTKAARKSLRSINSIHFTPEETKRYQIDLVKRIEQKVVTLLESTPTQDPSWNGTYRLLIDRYRVYYSFSSDNRSCLVEAVWHQHQQLE